MPPRSSASRVLAGLGVPVVLAPMAGGPSTPALAAAVINAGGLGFLAGGYLSADALDARIVAARQQTTGPLGVNVFVPSSATADRAHLAEYAARVRAWADARGYPVGEPRADDDAYATKLERRLADPVAVVSFTFGCPSVATVQALQRAGSEVWVTVTSVADAVTATTAGAEVLVVQGAEAGGHQGRWIDDPADSPLALPALLPLIRAATELPLVASGAIMTRAALEAALAAGASAGQLGSAFLLCPEAGTHPVHRAALLEGRPTRLTRAHTGRLARGLVNEFMARLDASAPVAYPEVHHLTAPLRAAARAAGDPEGVNLWAGEAYRQARPVPAAEVLASVRPDPAGGPS